MEPLAKPWEFEDSSVCCEGYGDHPPLCPMATSTFAHQQVAATGHAGCWLVWVLLRHISICKMPAMGLMHALEAEITDQEEEHRRSPFRSVDEVRRFVSDDNPSSETNITLEMCVVSVVNSVKHVRIELIDYDYASRVGEVLQLLDKLDVQCRNKFIFSLTLWKPKKRTVHESWEFTVGRVYCFAKVHALRLFYALPQGSSQLQSDFGPTPLLSSASETRDLDELQSAAKEVTAQQPRRGGFVNDEVPLNHDSDLNPSPKKRGRAAKAGANKKQEP